MMRVVLRSLRRNRWRSWLTIGGIALGVALIVWMDAFVDAWLDTMVQGATAGQLGQLQIHDDDYAEKPDFWETMPDDPARLDRLSSGPAIAAAAPRLRGFGLLAHGARTQVAMVVGVDPALEPAVTVTSKGLVAGRWLAASAPDFVSGTQRAEAVVGRLLATQLDLEVGDEAVIYLQTADGSSGDDVVRVVGVIKTGNADADRMTAWVHLPYAQYLSAHDGRIHEIALALAPRALLEDARAEASAHVSAAERLRTWEELAPDLMQLLEVSKGSMWVMYLIIFLLIALGILNTQRMSALERRREFGVLVAIGTTPRRLAAQVMLESIFLSLVGALLGVALGAAMVAYHASAGFDLGALASEGDNITYLGISFDGVVFFQLDPAALVAPVVWIIGVALLCGLWPAVKSALTNPVQAISGRG